MRSRVTMKQHQGGGGSLNSFHHTQQHHGRGRSNLARSLDRKEELKGRHLEGLKSRRSHSFYSPKEVEDLPKVAPPKVFREEKPDDLSGCDKDLPMDFQELLQSPVSDSEMKKCFGQPPNLGRNQVPSFIPCGTNITSSIWSTDLPHLRPSFQEMSWKVPLIFPPMERNLEPWYDIEGTSLSIEKEGNFFSSLIESSYSALNHNKASRFMEVVPKPLNPELKLVKTSHAGNPRQTPQATPPHEEDLLTSMKTHFRPIKQEENPVSQNSSKPYSDGTTFIISTSLEDVKFRRSDSGALYIGSEQKYMEYREAVESPSEFIPKFRVRQNEKFCQTEDESFSDNPSPGSEDQEDAYDCDLYFPGDESLLAEDMVSRLVDDEKEDESFQQGNSSPGGLSPFDGFHGKLRVDGWLTAWPLNTSAIWRNVNSSNDMSLFSESKPWPTEKECELLLM